MAITIFAELPFWLRTEGALIDRGSKDNHAVVITIRNNFCRLWANYITKNFSTVIYFGNYEKAKKSKDGIADANKIILEERCRTVLELEINKINSPVMLGKANKYQYRNFIFQFVIPHINNFIKHYRAVSFDQMVYEISGWDISFFLFKINDTPFIISPYDYLTWNSLPIIDDGKEIKIFYLIENFSEAFWARKKIGGLQPHELELLDAYNFKNRGDYKSALRRAVTAFEIMIDNLIINTLIGAGVNRKEAEDNVYYKNVNWKDKKTLFEKTLGFTLESRIPFLSVVEKAKNKRNDIVHRGKAINNTEHGQIRMFIDHIRFALNLLENNEDYVRHRDELLLRSNLEQADFLDQ